MKIGILKGSLKEVMFKLSNSLLSEQSCLTLRANKKIKVGGDNLTFAKTVNKFVNNFIASRRNFHLWIK
jgi:hypothetical protein